MKQKYLLLTILLFVFLFLFSTPSLALIPGDFGSTDNGPPDGVVDFEDLMIFALAYGSIPVDTNWNPDCDIASQGSPTPDGIIDFEDLMIFAMHYGEREGAAWTVMVYLDGDNNLYDFAWSDLGEMESVGSTNEVNIVVQLDSYSNPGTYRYYVTSVEQGSTFPYYSADIVQTLPEQNMADPNVLSNFINWTTTNYPAERYLLVLWNHGGGWRDKDVLPKGIIWDDTSGDFMTMIELAQGLEGASEQIDIIGFDACLMQMAEVAYEIGSSLTNPPNYGIASQELEWGYGWPYDDILSHLTLNPTINEATLCETIVNDYINYCGTPATLSAFQVTPEIANNGLSAINNFANALMNSVYSSEIATARSSAQSYIYYPEYKDFYDFAQIIYNTVPDCQAQAQEIMNYVNEFIIAEAHTGTEVANSHGLSIFLPDNSGGYDSNYDSLRFAIDTQWDEFLLGTEGVVTDVRAIPTTRHLSMSKEGEIVYLSEEENELLQNYEIMEDDEGVKGEVINDILVLWDAYYGVDGYRAYRSVDGGDFVPIFEWQDPPVGSSGYAFYDSDILEGKTYSYYVTAYGPDWETNPSNIVSITITSQTFLPACSLISPTDGSTITETNPVFSWSPVGLDAPDLPYGQIYSGRTYFRIYDASTFETAWSISFDNMTTSSVTYDQNGSASPLLPGHNYKWYVRTYGYDNNGNWVATSYSETWQFYYNGPAIVTGVWAYTITYQSSMSKLQYKIDQLVEEGKISYGYHLNELLPPQKGVVEHRIDIEWHSYPEATGYRVYRNVSETGYTLLDDWQPSYSYDWYGIWDIDVSDGTTYSYYVTAYGPDWETAPSQIITRDTFLPPCSLISPPDGSVVSESTPTFTWNPVGVTSFPYDSISSGDSDLWVYDDTANEGAWWAWFNNMTTSTATYNQDGYADPLVAGHSYVWNSWGYGYDANDNLIAISESEDWGFDYEGGVIPPSVYRAFLVGVGDYQYFPNGCEGNDLPSPPYDVDRMHDTLSHSGSGFSSINELIDLEATKAAILNGINTTFSGADGDDISYFYFTGHGMNYSGVSYLCPTDIQCDSPLSSYISTNELESALSAIPGTKVVILDCCHSGGFIGKQIGEENIFTDAQEFNENVINVFLSKDLTSSQYKVLTSCLSSQVCWELIPSEGDPFGLFSGVLCLGCGYDTYIHPYPADGNGNSEITLHEAYTYTYEMVNAMTVDLNDLYGWDIDQDTQVYPLNSDFVIIEE